MNPIRAVLEILLSKWLWIPILFMLTTLFSLYLGAKYGILGYFAAFFWVYIWVGFEIIRQFNLLPKSERWETEEERFKQLLEEAEKSRRKYKEL